MCFVFADCFLCSVCCLLWCCVLCLCCLVVLCCVLCAVLLLCAVCLRLVLCAVLLCGCVLYGLLLIFFVRTPLRNSCPFSPAATSCNHGDSDPHPCPLSTCPSAPWPDLVPSLLVGPPDHAQRVGAIPVDAVSTWLDHFPRCPEEPIDWWHHHRLDLWASDYVGSGSRFIG